MKPHARYSLTALCLIGPLSLASIALSGCGGSIGQNDDTEEAQYVVPKDEPGKPISDIGFIKVTDRIPGARLTSTVASKMNLTEEIPRKIIDGRQTFTKEQYSAFINAPNLRLDSVFAPADAAVVLVDVGTDSTYPLKPVSSADRDKFVPAPLLHDNIGNTYWPIGYFYKDLDNETLEINIDLSRQFKNLNRIPPLSRSKRQELSLIYQVNAGVNLTAISYGGYEKLTFNKTTENEF